MDLDIVQWHTPKCYGAVHVATGCDKAALTHMPPAGPVDYLQQVQEGRQRPRTECGGLLWR